VFWSGIQGDDGVAAQWAVENGAATSLSPKVRRATLCHVASTNVDDIYAAIRGLPIPDRLKLVERVVHDITEAQAIGPVKRDPRAAIGGG
jgi:hypothetical protein